MGKAKKTAVIFDIDGTLADTSHWDEKVMGPFDQCKWAEINKNPAVIETGRILFNALRATVDEVLFVTARPDTEDSRIDTEYFLTKNGFASSRAGFEPKLYMRPVALAGGGVYSKRDKTPAAELKKMIYIFNILPNYYVTHAVDDRLDVINMWQSLGIQGILIRNNHCFEATVSTTRL